MIRMHSSACALASMYHGSLASNSRIIDVLLKVYHHEPCSMVACAPGRCEPSTMALVERRHNIVCRGKQDYALLLTRRVVVVFYHAVRYCIGICVREVIVK